MAYKVAEITFRGTTGTNEVGRMGWEVFDLECQIPISGLTTQPIIINSGMVDLQLMIDHKIPTNSRL